MDSELKLESLVGKELGFYTHQVMCVLTHIGGTIWEVCPISSKVDRKGNHSDLKDATYSIEAPNDFKAQQAAEDLVRKFVAKHLRCKPHKIFFESLVWKPTH